MNDNKIRVMKIPPPHGTILTMRGVDAMHHAATMGADAILLEPITLLDGTILPIDTPMKRRADGYWEPIL